MSVIPVDPFQRAFAADIGEAADFPPDMVMDEVVAFQHLTALWVSFADAVNARADKAAVEVAA
jgi:hypothetical protein